ncbi:MAG: T9SS type A sorting domain-containing protein [Bacteroidales bacterium]|jgi:flavodoxin|nr:T9SS type A sorting domain-containing protein [Bacteroidales bacterium]
MKRRFFILFMMIGVALSINACNSDNDASSEEENQENINANSGSGNLIVFYSWSGNSRAIANELHSILNCDMVEILPATPYTTDYNTVLDVAQSEISAIDRSGSYPSITNNLDSIGDYDAIFVCYPLWWSRMATPAQSFLHKHSEKLNGKTVALVCTSASSGISGTVADARRICPNSVFTEALHIRSANVANARNLLTQWLETIGLSGSSNTGIQAVNNADYQIYPNPARDYVQVSGEFEQLTLLNANGATVAETRENIVSVKSLPTGIYFLIIKSKTMKEFVRKVVKM